MPGLWYGEMWGIKLLEICPGCYSKHFPVYKNMKYELSKEKTRCCWCGEVKNVIRKVYANGDLVDIN